MNISSDTLFHFTSKIEYLENILKNNFSPRACLETVYGSEELGFPDAEWAFPMVCFCDIPLSQVKSHMDTYGRYCIGLSKDWGIRNKISPVLYHYKDSPNHNAILKVVDKITEEVKKSLGLNVRDVLNTTLYSKPYKGKFYRNGEYLKDEIIFYNEREWRYIPSQKTMEEANLNMFLYKEDYSEESKGKFNEDLNKIKIKFEPKDVKYIIVKDDSDILRIVDLLLNVKGKYSYNDVKILTTRIITSKQILEDF